MNYVFLGDSPTLETGFARVTKNIVPYLNLKNKHFWGIGYNNEPNYFDFPIYPANLDSSWQEKRNANRLRDFLLNLNGPITLWIIHDSNRFSNFINIFREVKQKKYLKIIAYIPVDSYLNSIQDIEFLKIVDVPVAYTEFGKAEIKNLIGDSKEINVIPHGNDVDFKKTQSFKEEYFPNYKDCKILGVVNSNTHRKNLFRSFEIFYHLLNLDPTWRLYLHAESDGYYQLQKIAYEMGILDKCIFADNFFDKKIVGYKGCAKEELIKIYNSIDLYLSTSIGEGWGLTATEAASCEVPIALGRHTSYNEIFDDESCIFLENGQMTYYQGKIVPDFNSIASANKINNEYLNSIERVKRAKKIVDSFDWVNTRIQWENLISAQDHYEVVDNNPILISSAMRVGSTWILKMISYMKNKEKTSAFIDKYVSDPSNNLDDVSEFIQKSDKSYVFKSHQIYPESFEELINKNKSLKIVNIVRDKRNALESRYYYAKCHEKSKTEVDQFIEDNNLDPDNDDLCKESILNSEIGERWLQELNEFDKNINTENIITLNYDKLKNKDRDELLRLVKFLDSKHDPNHLYEEFDFQKMQTQEKEATNRAGNQLFVRCGK